MLSQADSLCVRVVCDRETPRVGNGLSLNGQDPWGAGEEQQKAEEAAEAHARQRRVSCDSARGRAGQQFTHLLCISPDAPTNPVLFWLSTFDAAATRFLLESAKGPLRLDLGDTLYAPNLMLDEQVHGLSPFVSSSKSEGTLEGGLCRRLCCAMLLSKACHCLSLLVLTASASRSEEARACTVAAAWGGVGGGV